MRCTRRSTTVQPEKLRAKLLEAKEVVLESRELMRLVRDIPVSLDLDATRVGDYDRDAVIKLFREYEFRTLIDRLPPLRGEGPEEAAARLRELGGDVGAARAPGSRPLLARQASSGDGLQLSLDFDSVGGAGSGAERPVIEVAEGDLPGALAAAIEDPRRLEVRDAAGLDGLEPWLAGQPDLSVSLVASDPRPIHGEPLAFAVAGTDGRVVVADTPDAIARLRGQVEASGRRLVGHEVKAILTARFVEAPGSAPLPVAFDTQIAAYVLNASLRSQSIADVAAERLDVQLPPPKDVDAATRAGLEALAAAAVRPPLERALAEVGLDRLFGEMELPLIAVLARMEATGVALDLDALGVLEREFNTEIARLEREIFAAVGHEFTIGSPKQLGEVLFGELQLPFGRKTKTGYSTDAAVLEELRTVHPVIEPILDWRTYTKLRSTYVEALPSLIASDGRLHTTFHQAVAATGRLSSSDPNLQNIPIRTELGRRIRRAFVAGAPDLTLVAADYSQIELRILAHVSGDVHLKDAFEREADIHRETAALVLHKDPADVTPAERSMAKMVNFGIAYGMSDFGLSSRAGISRQEAQAFITNYFATYSGISYYMLHIKEVAKTQGFVTTLLGRKRSIPELASRIPALRGAGERMAINMPIQGTAADIMKIAMIRVADRLAAEGSPARMLLQVHDELLFEVPRDGGRTARGDRSRDDGGRAPARRAADGRRQGRRRLGVDAADPAPGRRARRPGLGPADAGASRGRDRRARSAPAHRRRDDRRGPLLVEPDAAHPQPRGLRRRRRGPAGGGGRSAGEAARHRPVRRRRPDDPPQDDRAAVRRPGRDPRGPLHPAGPRARRWPGAAVPRHPQVRPGRALRPGTATGELVTEVGAARSSPTSGRSPSTIRSRSASSATAAAAQGPAQAAPPRPVLPRGRRQHLRRRGALAVPAPPAAVRRDAPAARRAPAVRAIRSILAEAVERRGSSIDDYTAPDGDGAMQERLAVYQRTGEPCPRCGRPLRRIVVGARSTHFCSWCQRLPAADRAGAPDDPADDDRRPPRRRGASLDGARRGRGASGRTPTRRHAPPRGPGPSGRSGPRRPAALRRARPPGPARGRLMSILRFAGVTREVGAFVILDRIDAAHRGRRPGRARRPERRRQDDAAAARGGPRRAGSRAGRAQARADARAARPGGALRRGVHGRAGPAHGGPARRRRTSSGWPRRSATLEREGRVTEPAYADLQHEFDVLGGYTLDQRVDAALSGARASRATEWAKPPAAMSGGEQTRASLARLVIADPDLLLLDEPTNHLDLDALEWLEEHLRRRAGLAARRVPRPGVPRRDRRPASGSCATGG